MGTQRQYTETTELWEATEQLGLLAASRAHMSLGEATNTEDYVHVPHAALAALLASRAAQPRAAPSEAEVTERLRPFMERALEELDDTQRHHFSPFTPEARRRMRAACAALDSGAASTRAVPLADRLARLQAAHDQLEAQSELLQAEREAADEEYDAYDVYERDGSTELHLAAVQLWDGAFALRGWMAELEGRALSPRAQLLELLRAAREAGQDVLVYHHVG